MNTITKKNIETEKTILINLLKDVKNITMPIQTKLKDKGYTLKCLGTGKQSYTYSKQIKIFKLNNTYLKGNFFGVGVYNQQRGKGHNYYAFIKKIVD